MIGGNFLKGWARTPNNVTLSSAEAELYSISEGASRGLGFQSMLREMGLEVNLVVSTDSSAAKAFASTRGLGRMRHVEVKDLWLQALVRDGRVVLRKVRTNHNASDVMTKYHDRDAVKALLALAGIKVVSAEILNRAEGGC